MLRSIASLLLLYMTFYVYGDYHNNRFDTGGIASKSFSQSYSKCLVFGICKCFAAGDMTRRSTRLEIVFFFFKGCSS